MARVSKSDGAKRFDPRFSPEFQPGFDARVHGEATRSAAPAAVSGPAPESLITRPARRAQARGAQAPGAQARGVQDAAGDATGPVDESGEADGLAAGVTVAGEGADVDSSDEAEPLAWWRRLNPFLVALGVVGVALIVVALGWMAWVYEAATSPTTQQFDYLIMQFAMFGAPILLSVGVLSLVLILVVLAVRYRR